MGMLGGSGLEGIIFIGVAWFLWIIATFFMKRNSKERLKISFVLLMLIILSPFQLSFFDFQLNTAAVFLYLYLLVEVIQLKNKIGWYLFITSFIIMLAYVSFLMMELYDPVWVIFDRKWMIGIILVYLCLLLEDNKKLRYYSLLLGTLQGEWIFSFILKRFTFDYPVGDYTFFDTIGLSILLLSTWNMLELATVFLENQTKHIGRGKQKTS
jgi:hypothetical protein